MSGKEEPNYFMLYQAIYISGSRSPPQLVRVIHHERSGRCISLVAVLFSIAPRDSHLLEGVRRRSCWSLTLWVVCRTRREVNNGIGPCRKSDHVELALIEEFVTEVGLLIASSLSLTFGVRIRFTFKCLRLCGVSRCSLLPSRDAIGRVS